MKLVVVLSILGLALAAPQGLDADAEILPGGIRPPRRPTSRGNDDGFEILVLEPRPRTNVLMSTLLRELFGLGGTLGRRTGGDASPATRPPAGEDSTPLQESGNTPNLFFDRPFFTDIFRRPFFPRVPSISGLPSFDSFPDLPDLPNNYDNSTHEVKIVNGSRVEMNRTISKTTNGNGGVFFTHVHTIRRLPEGAPNADSDVSAAGGEPQESPEETDIQTPKPGTVPQGNSADNQVEPYEDFGLASEVRPNRPRRWIFKWLQDTAKRSSTPAPTHHTPTPAHHSPAPAHHTPAPAHHTPAPAHHTPAPAHHTPAPAHHNHLTPAAAHYNHPNALDLPTDKITYNLKPKYATELNMDAEIFSNRVPTHSSLPISSASAQKPSTRPVSSARVPIINDNDIAVNYIGAVPRPSNPDAEIFDFDLIRENERRFFEGRSQPKREQPHAFQPIRSQPMLYRSLRTQPMFQPIRSQPMFQPIRSQPMFQPIRSQPMFQPIRSQL